jgi:alpha-beta hydrolase superfamily lysophospholipase
MWIQADSMKNIKWVKTGFALLMSFSALSAVVPPAFAGESTMPSSWVENISPELAAKYAYTEDGEFTQALKIPTYEWMPVGVSPKVVVIGIHGLTLHGRRMRVLARSLAVNGVGFISLDMRGFGRCKFDEKHQFSTPENDRTKINHHKSYDDIVQLATLVKQKYPDAKIVALGESLGCTFCVHLAAEHPEIISGIILSAPAVRLNKDMYAGRGQIVQGVKAALLPHHEVDLTSFFTELCSKRADIQKEMADDPMVLKELTLEALVSTDAFCDKTADFGKATDPSLAVLILQGSADGCVSPKHVTDLMNSMRSTDQCLDWRGNFGHLQLETTFMQAETISAIANWMQSHTKERKEKLKQFEQQITDLGGTVLK